ncbi:hypothetical protein ACQUFY_15250 [Robbsia andropogonis]|uniref:hypothetical protein n=1 Tax=Robbsia andropogonis TaxID=28092 RepID=UPI003D252312
MMSFRNASSTAPGIAALNLAEFRRRAECGSAVAVVRDRTSVKVIAVGLTPDARSVAWLRANEDTAAHFVSSLGNAFGKRIAEHTARELNLTSYGSVPLTASLIQNAIEMAESAKASLEGVAFMQTLHIKASLGTAL